MFKAIIGLFVIIGGAFVAYKNGLLNQFIESSDKFVKVLNESNFDTTISQNEHVLVEFYAPWCGHCKKLTPEYGAAAEYFSTTDLKVVLGKVDATENKTLGDKYEIKGFPTLKWFKNGEHTEYNGGRTKDLIISWVSRQLGQFSEEIKTEEQLNEFINSKRVGVVYFKTKAEGAQWEEFKKVGIAQQKISFAQVSNPELAKLQNSEEGKVILFKQFDEKKVEFTQELTEENLNKFIDANKVPVLLEFDDNAIETVFQSGLSTVFIFHNETEKSMEGRKTFEKIAQEKRGKIIFSTSTPKDASGHFDKLGEFVGADLTNLPSFVIIDTASGKIEKYLFDKEVSEENLNTFVDSFLNGTLEKTLKSEEIPESNDEAVLTLVGKNFQQEVIKTTKDVLVKFYAPWCGHCKSLAPHWDEAAEKLKENKNIVLAKIDSTKNDVADVEIEGFPTLKFFPGNDKTNVIEYTGQRTTEGIINWLKENTTHEWVELSQEQATEEKKEEKQEDL